MGWNIVFVCDKAMLLGLNIGKIQLRGENDGSLILDFEFFWNGVNIPFLGQRTGHRYGSKFYEK